MEDGFSWVKKLKACIVSKQDSTCIVMLSDLPCPEQGFIRRTCSRWDAASSLVARIISVLESDRWFRINFPQQTDSGTSFWIILHWRRNRISTIRSSSTYSQFPSFWSFLPQLSIETTCILQLAQQVTVLDNEYECLEHWSVEIKWTVAGADSFTTGCSVNDLAQEDKSRYFSMWNTSRCPRVPCSLHSMLNTQPWTSAVEDIDSRISTLG